MAHTEISGDVALTMFKMLYCKWAVALIMGRPIAASTAIYAPKEMTQQLVVNVKDHSCMAGAGRSHGGFPAKAGCCITSATADGIGLSLSETAAGTYTFANVTTGNTIDVKSTSVTMNVVEGKGNAEYRASGGVFLKCTVPAYVPANAGITVRAVAGDGYAFSGWVGSGGLTRPPTALCQGRRRRPDSTRT